MCESPSLQLRSTPLYAWFDDNGKRLRHLVRPRELLERRW